MRYEWFIAKRYLKPQGGATFIFHLTLISMIGVALGVASLVVVLSVMNGFANDLRGKILEGISHIVITYRAGLEDYEKIMPNFLEIDNVEAVSPAIIDWGVLFVSQSASSLHEPVTFVGIDPAYDAGVTRMADKLIAGDIDSLTAPAQQPSNKMVSIEDIVQKQDAVLPGIIIGKELATNLLGIYPVDGVADSEVFKAALGAQLSVMALPRETETISMNASRGGAKEVKFRVTGVFDSGNYEFDSSWVYVSIPSAQYLIGMNGRVTNLQFRLRDHSIQATTDTMNEIIKMNNRLVSSRGYVQSWRDMRKTFFEALEIEKLTMNIILRIIILVATFNIIATLFMVVTEKTRDIGLLRAIGAGRANVMSVFIMLGIYIGALGALLGVGIGYAICVFLQVYPIEMPGGGSVYYLRYIPCEPEIADFIWVTVYTFVISLLASIYPAIRASRAIIVESLRFS
ncbi:MAG: FtsX-like permease family protein [bacterium]|nr:FtsX-like permease family protein [bacterium]